MQPPQTDDGVSAVAANNERYANASFAAEVERETSQLRDMLIAKNRAYGNSALEPVRVFAPEGLTASAQIRVRLDDKLSRLARGGEYAGDDTVLDLLGYLVLLRIAERLERADGA